MDKNTVIAFLIIGIIFLLWMSPWYQKSVVGVPEIAPDSTAVITMQADTAQAYKNLQQSGRAKQTESTPVKIQPTASGTKDTTVLISNDMIEAMLSSRGGGTLVSWKLIEKNPEKPSEYRYRTRVTEDDPVELIPEIAEGNLAITTDRNLDFGRLPFSLIKNATDAEGTQTLQFSHQMAGGAQLIKTFILHPGSYDLDMDVRFIGFNWEQIGENFHVLWQSGLNSTEPNIHDDLMYYEAVTFQGEELTKQKKKGSTGFRDGNTHWVGIHTKYFLMAILPEETGVGAELDVEGDDQWKTLRTDLAMSWKGYQDESHSFKIFLGPMDYHLLKSYQTNLDKSMSWGMKIIKPFSLGALYALEYLYSKIHNYGWAIIIFAIFIKIILYPLTRHSYQSMREMQALQPKMKALQEKYKNDPKKLNEETMKLYKTHGVNPMGGCLPMILQMPVLFALFNLFRSTIMLRHAEFYLIKDLSGPDHLIGSINVLPIVMGAATILQQKLSSVQNSQQKAMAYMMPIFLTFVFYKFSAGLNLYYTVFTVFTIAQELLVKRSKSKEATEE